MSTVAMPPSPSSSRAFHNKPYYPNLALRRSTRLLATDSTSARTSSRRQHQTAPQPTSTKRRRTPNATPTTSRTTAANATAAPTAPVASSSKRKADSLSVEDDDDETSSPITNRRKKRKENSVTEKASSVPQMRATIQNKPRPRSSTNKYGTRSATPSLSVTDAVTPTSPALEESLPEHPATSRQPSPPPPSLPPKVIDEVVTEPSPCPAPPVATHIMVTGETPSAPITVEPLQQDVEMYIPEAPVPTSPSTSYVTYTDLTPSFPEHHFHGQSVPMQSVPLSPSPPQPQSLLSELHDSFGFSCDPDLDPHIAFTPQPLQDQMEPVSYGNGSIDDWNAQRQMEEYEKQKKEAMKACQRQDRLWIAWTSKKFNYLIDHYGGISEVRALLKAQIQRAEAHKAGAESSNKENITGRASSTLSTSISIDTHSPPPIQPSFEMYSPETDESEIGDKSDMEYEDEEDSDSSADDDMVPEPEVDPNFELPPAPVLSPLKANPCSGRLVLFGTPPFLERRKAWGGDNLLTLSMKSSTDLQQVRPQTRGYSSSLLSQDLPTLSYTAPSADSPYIDAPSNVPYPPSSAEPSYPDTNGPIPDFSSGDLPTTNSFDDPSIMQAIIASMTPGLDFGFGNSINWADGMSPLPEVAHRGWHTSPPTEESSLPRSSHTLNASSSTLHSALG